MSNDQAKYPEQIKAIDQSQLAKAERKWARRQLRAAFKANGGPA